MKARARSAIAIFAIVAIGAAIFLSSRSKGARSTAQQTKATLRKEGFKLEIEDFQRTNSEQARSALQILIEAGYACSDVTGQDSLKVTQLVGSNGAVVIWAQKKLPSRLTDDFWPELRSKFEERRAKLDLACATILANPIRCEVGLMRDEELITTTDLGALKHLSFGLRYRLLLELHDGNRDAAWTNLMAVTRLVTARDMEPVEVAHMARMAILLGAQDATWQALQTNFWTDVQLAALQHEWESLDLFANLSETAAVAGANAVMKCRLEREGDSSSASVRQLVADTVHSPKAGWQEMVSKYRELAYRNHGSYEYENTLMLYFRDREVEIKNAMLARSWSEMRSLPGVTNRPPYPQDTNSLRGYLRGQRGTQRENPNGTLLGRSAGSEARRRLVVTALALERCRLEKGTYPNSLTELTPEWLAVAVPDYMDGKPLRYEATPNGHFTLYSVGLDCIDGGGDMRQVKYWHEENGARTYSRGPEIDLVWPRPASPTELEQQQQQ